MGSVPYFPMRDNKLAVFDVQQLPQILEETM